MKFWNREAETMSRDALEALQLKGLQKTLRRVWACDWWRDLLHKRGMSDPADVKSLDDLRRLPFLTKEDFREAYPLKMSTVDRKELLEFHMSSGSTGTPVVMAYTKNDLNQWADTMARCFTMAGLEAGDAFQIMPTFGLFNGGFGCYHGCRKAGLFCVPASSGNTERQIKLMRDFRVKGFCSVVSYVPRVIEKLDADASGDHDIPSLRVGIFGSETFSDEMRKKIENRLHIECFDIYGMIETGGIGTTGQDCSAHAGIHVWDDYYITEVVNPATGEPVPDGEYGEVVFTSLSREAMPIIRYRTHDISRILSREKCACGRTHIRIDRITGRTDDMLIVKGVNFYPRQVEQALMEIPGVKDEFQIILEEHNGMTDVTINVEAEPGVTGHTVAKHLRERLGFLPKGDVFPVGALPRTEGKAKRVIRKKVD
ncbi:MAG: phenylacetate--CoA ligase [Kiritimatiellae bacterium]|nr:phenylacetate--CoA ligase [Kiritimatiellia bacterium]